VAHLRLVTQHARCILHGGVVTAFPHWRSRALDSDRPPFNWEAVTTFNAEAAQEVLPLDLRPGETYAQAWDRNRIDAGERARANLNAGRAFLTGETSYRNEWRCTDRHDVEHWLQETVTVSRLDGERWQVLSVATDITSLKVAQMELRDEQELLRSAKDLAGLGVFDSDLTTGSVWWDQRVRELWGVGRTEPITFDQALAEVHPDDREMVVAILHRSNDPAGDGRYTAEFRVVGRDDGAVRWLSANGRTFFQEGAPVRRIGTVQDITPHKDAERQLRHEQDLLRQAQELAGLGVFEADLLTGEVSWDPRLRALWGIGRDVTLAGDDGWEAVHPDDREALAAALTRSSDPAGNGRFQITLRIGRRSDGQLRWLAVNGQTYFQEGRPTGRVAAMQDVTEVQQAQEELRLVTAGTQCLLWHAVVRGLPGWRDDPENRAGTMDWNLHIQNEQGGQNMMALEVPPGSNYAASFTKAKVVADYWQMNANAHRALLQGAPNYRQEFRCLDRDGQTVWLSERVTIQPMGPETWRLLGVVTNITADKQAEAELKLVMSNVRCLLWHAEVTGRPGWRDDPENRAFTLDWQFRIQNEQAGQNVVSLELPAGETYADAFMRTKFQDERWAMNAVAHRALLEGAAGYEQEFRRLDRDGRIVWLQERATIEVLGPDRWRLAGVVTDVTARKQAEAERRLVLTNARCILWSCEVSALPGWLDDPENRSQTLVWGMRMTDERAAQQVLALDLPPGTRYSDAMVRARVPEDHWRINANAQQALRDGHAGYTQEYRCRDRYGQTVWLREVCSIEPLGPDRWLVVGVAANITADKRLEAERQLMLSTIPGLLYQAEVIGRPGWRDDPENRAELLDWYVRLHNEQAARRVFEFDVPPGSTAALAMLASRPEADRWQANRIAHAALIAGLPGYDHEFRCLDRQGQPVWLNERATVEPLGPDHWRVVSVITNITARKQAEAEREELIDRLAQALGDVRQLTGLLPMCAWCGKVRDDEGYWTQVEQYIAEHTEARVTHGICPECLGRVDAPEAQ
jgi:PAS domain S-box-containing protein